MVDGDVSPEVKKRRQAEVTVDKVEEALENGEYGEAADAVVRLSQHVSDLLEGDDDADD